MRWCTDTRRKEKNGSILFFLINSSAGVFCVVMNEPFDFGISRSSITRKSKWKTTFTKLFMKANRGQKKKTVFSDFHPVASEKLHIYLVPFLSCYWNFEA